MLTFALETSCDETSIALVKSEVASGCELLYLNTATQIALHKEYGGIVPELSARAHLDALFPMLEDFEEKTGYKLEQIDRIGVTTGPGLQASLLIAVAFANTLSRCLERKIFPVNHLKAHIFAYLLDPEIREQLSFPFMALLVSGGHTEIVRVDSFNQLEVIGRTLDDAAGECLDKTARQMDLGYPGGPVIDRLAKKGIMIENLKKPLPRPLPEKSVLNYSFSGMKTAFSNLIKEHKEESVENLCFTVQKAVVDHLSEKFTLAKKSHGIKQGLVCGGVAANSFLRATLGPENNFFVPLKFCTDNAAMIAACASILPESEAQSDLKPQSNWPIAKNYEQVLVK